MYIADAGNNRIRKVSTAGVISTFAGTGSQDQGNNTGWTFPSISIAPVSLSASVNPVSAVCNGGTTTTLTQSGGSLGSGAYWQWYTNASYTNPVGPQLSSANASLSVGPSVTTTYYLRAEVSSCISPVTGPSSGLTITVGPSVSLSSSVSHILCNGASNGSASLSITGGTSPYSYIWTNGGTTSSVSGLAAGSYLATVTDTYGCTAKIGRAHV